MQALDLAKVAAAAETLRVRRYARRQGIRIGYALGAVLLILAILAMIHVLLIVLLAMAVQLWLAVLIVLAIDLVAGGVLGSLALRNTPDRIEREAEIIRRQSLAEAKSAAKRLATVSKVAGLALGMIGRRRVNSSSNMRRAWMIADLASRFVRR